MGGSDQKTGIDWASVVTAVAVAAAALVLVRLGQAVVMTVLAAALILSLLWVARLRRLIHYRIPSAFEPVAAEADGRSRRTYAADELATNTTRPRVEVHPVSGLPVRESLVDRIRSDRQGLLGVLAFDDFDRLSAFDPMLADRVFAACSSRLRSMTPAGLFLSHVDRGYIAAWFGPDIEDAEAWAQLDAVAYALGEAIIDGETQVVPQVAFRLAAFDTDQALSPSAFITRTVASFAVLSGPAVKAATPIVDQAEMARDRFELEQDLRLAVDRREFRLDYQPLVDASQGCVSGAEALIRWEHPTRGLISPSRFVPMIEAMGLAQEMGMWALNTALRDVCGWSSAGLGRLRVAVNVSSLQLANDDLPQLILRTLQSHGVSASQLEIELTESVATSDTAHCLAIFQVLRAMGIKLAVDDFGTGYSGFSVLRSLAFDKIKIDREFVTDVDSRSDSQAICQSIIALGRGLGIRILAEGVERFAEYEWLRRHGCHHFQGYYFGRPMPNQEFLDFARDRNALTERLSTRIDATKILERLTA
ncbi:putative bifunctional diguanylate cyclase/phosphodiesterase [Sphingomonas sp. LT1P40]|uniref:putative bifunctional diguanylate cyclase/phosphodiesterase n=1 Tax=Alteristakelama amylovorans TaxID=3096166 RepID=UPI002FCBB49F